MNTIHTVVPESISPTDSSGRHYFPWDEPGFALDPYPWYARALAHAPLIYDDLGFYVLSRYHDVMAYGKHPAMSVEPGWEQAGPWSVARDTVIGRDLPDHTRLRRQTNKWFGPKIVDRWTETTATVVSSILDSSPDGILDGWHDLSVIPTHRTMCRVLGVPDDDHADVQEAMSETMPMMAAKPATGAVDRAAAGFDELGIRVNALIADKQANPGDGLLDSLLTAVDRDEITIDEARATALMLYGLGHMDVGYLIAAGLNIFAARPDVYDRYRESVDLRDSIINEIVRFDPPELCFYRVTTSPVTIRSVDIPTGSKVRFMIAAANRDPEVFDNPDTFEVSRPPRESRNLSFGMGPHTCAGQYISRAQARAVFDQLAHRFRRIEHVDEPQMDNTDFSRHFTSLTLRLVE
ncbi:cytochrome P450 [Rhodococcus sp. NCIMB 12038]|uniref:cytochrome P450 n=1 Tax=Rhodococcus sp. NCIMB 12038 TaxID=933800 RepID=UPI0015C62804|nr:cytochrome P450 [Rhodococcus sp. NCIMB 12038]